MKGTDVAAEIGAPGSATSPLPRFGRSREEVLADLEIAQRGDLDWRQGRQQGAVYWASDEVVGLAQEAMRRYYFTNPIYPNFFPSLVEMGRDVLGVAAGLMHGQGGSGIVTTGGSESNFLAVWTALGRARAAGRARDHARVIVPFSAHPTFDKACQYLGIELVRIPLTDAFQVNVDAVALAVTDDTILLVGSAPDYSHGIIDPIRELGELALGADVNLHVDSCVGGFMLPFVEHLGRSVEPWDFRVPGVTSISADVHKHGLGPKGVSVLLTHTPELAAHATFQFENWPHGNYMTTTVEGSRSGAAIAGAWAVFQFMGEDGFLDHARKTMELTDAFQAGIGAIDGLGILGRPSANKFSYGATGLDIMAIAGGLESRGWYLARQGEPEAIGMHVGLFHATAVDPYLADLREVAALVATGDIVASGSRASYN
jgi:sphinganine-1-phosphate aldolase